MREVEPYSILILHGWGSCAKNWIKVKELLEARGYKVFVPDLPGFGENPPLVTAWNIDNYVEWVKDFSEKNNLPRIFLMGHSFGGSIGIKFAVRYPEKLEGLILAAAGRLTKRNSLKNFLFLVLAKTGKLFFRQQLFKRIIYKLAGSGDYLLAKGVMKETMRNVINEDLRPFLPEITTKTLVVWGDKDKETPVADAYLIKREVKNSFLEVLPNVGHRIRLEAPEILVEKIVNFIKL
ncbi:MAG: Alpha/beta hydrolase fold protein [Parcubacteria group bacterium GW2011_GWF2_43_11]|nr:MAG: Alpha/beta hydrolase fold protein [Parcubacteria group bacterium GW2011_GWF2_43_11]